MREATAISRILFREGFSHGGIRLARKPKRLRGTAIGHKKIDRFAPVEVSRVRLRCTQSAAEPLILKLAVYNVSTAGMP